jgi:DNA-binding GntR family transcriptional regulator
MVGQIRVRAFRLLFAGILSVQHVRESAVGHVEIATAVLNGDPERAENAMRRQLQTTADQALALLEKRTAGHR